jgi:hypothetical protein
VLARLVDILGSSDFSSCSTGFRERECPAQAGRRHDGASRVRVHVAQASVKRQQRLGGGPWPVPSENFSTTRSKPDHTQGFAGRLAIARVDAGLKKLALEIASPSESRPQGVILAEIEAIRTERRL